MLNSFSRWKNFFVVLTACTLFSIGAQALVLSLNPEAGYFFHNFYNAQSETSPFRGIVYGIDADLMTGRAHSQTKFIFSGFYNFGNLTNSDVPAETQSTSLFGLGAGLQFKRFKLKGGYAFNSIGDLNRRTQLNLSGAGPYVSASAILTYWGIVGVELGARYFALGFSTSQNPTIQNNLSTGSFLFYLSFDFHLGLDGSRFKEAGR